MNISLSRLNDRGFRKVAEVPTHVVDISVREGRGLERGVNMNKPSTLFPSAEGDATVGFVSCGDDGFQVLIRGTGRGCICEASIEVRYTFFDALSL